MKISRSLNLVIPVDLESGRAYVHSTPISREVFEEHYLVMSKTFAQIFTQGLGAVAGPRIAALMLKDTAGDQWDTVQKGLMNEIIRLSNIAIPTDKGWESLPLYSAFQKGLISDDDKADIEGQLVFFTLVARLNKSSQVEGILTVAGGFWGSEVTVSGFTEYLSSLPISTKEEITGETANTVSLPG